MAHTIDNIIVHADDPGLMYWFVDGKRMGPLRRDYADKLGIHVGATWNKAKARKVEHLGQLNSCHAAALAFLAKRDFTRALLLERLCRKWPEAIAQVTVDQMCAAGWVNDKTYATRRAAKLTERKIVSPELLQARLSGEGVADSLAEKSARAAATTLTQLCAEAKRLVRAGKSATSIARTFSRAGFDLDTIESAFAKARIPWNSES
jgi:SOS response regulatory protein OraA/RecX